MKITHKKVLIFIVVLVTVLVACGAGNMPQEAEVQTTDLLCPTGTTIYDVPVSEESKTLDSWWSVYSFIERPNPGCNLPARWCTYMSAGYSGGYSCSVIEE